MKSLSQILPLAGAVGWFLFTFTLSLGKQSALRALLWTLCYWFVATDAIAIVAGTLSPIIRQQMTGLRFICFFVLLPYFLCGLRVYWLVRKAKRSHISSPEPSHATNPPVA